MKLFTVIASCLALTATALEVLSLSADEYAQLERLREALRSLQQITPGHSVPGHSGPAVPLPSQPSSATPAPTTSTAVPLDLGGVAGLVLPPAVSGAPLGSVNIVLKLIKKLLKSQHDSTTSTTTTTTTTTEPLNSDVEAAGVLTILRQIGFIQ